MSKLSLTAASLIYTAHPHRKEVAKGELGSQPIQEGEGEGEGGSQTHISDIVRQSREKGLQEPEG
jgi:hypothetical protein